MDEQIAEALLREWRKVPDLRLGQLIWHAAELYFREIGRPRTDQNVGEYLNYVTDEKLAEIVAVFVERLQG